MTGILQAIGQSCGTDKADRLHAFAGETYMDIYEKYFSLLRDKPLNLLEIGVKDGQSLAAWRKYFKYAYIFGIDIDPVCSNLNEGGVVDIAIGSQDDPEFLRSCFPSWKFNIIIDDGSHINSMTLAAFKILFYERLHSGGLYIIEDLMCSYDKLQSEQNILAIWPGMKYNDPNKCYDNDRKVMDEFFQRKIYDLDHQRGEIRFLHFWSMLCVIGKV
jgi:hypothetical protein